MQRDLLVKFSSLFWGQTECWFDLKKMSTTWTPLTTERFAKHLVGEIELGVYCINDLNQCYWGCIDLDDKRDWLVRMAASEIRDEYERAGITAHIERSRSKGYHIWIFPLDPMPANVLRSAQLQILERVGISNVEVNPKQTSIWNTARPKTSPNSRRYGIGNLVRIPYSASRDVVNNRMCFLDDNNRPLDVAEATERAWQGRTLPSVLSALAAQSDELQRAHDGNTRRPVSVSTGGGGRSQEAYDIWQGDRDIESGERDNQFYTLAKLMFSNNVPYSNAYDMFVTIYKQKVLDKQGFSMDDALRKLNRVYEG